MCGRPQINPLSSGPKDKGDGLSGDLLVKQSGQDASIIANDEYKGRVSMMANSSLLLSKAKLTDQRTFTCMVVAGGDIAEYPVNVVVYSEYNWCQAQGKWITTPPLFTFLSSSAEAPTELRIEKAEELEIGKLTKVGVFNAKCCSYLRNFRHLKHQGKTRGSRGIIETTLLL